MLDNLQKTRRNILIPSFVDQEMKDSGLNISEWVVEQWMKDNYSTTSLKQKLIDIDKMISKREEIKKKIKENEKFIDLTLTPLKSQERNFFRRMDILLKRNEGDELMCESIFKKSIVDYYKNYKKKVSRETLLARLKAYRKSVPKE